MSSAPLRWHRREKNPNGGSLLKLAFNFHKTAMGLDYVFDDSQSESGPSEFPRARFIHAVEALRKSWKILFRYAAARVCYCDLDHRSLMIIGGGLARNDLDPASGRRVL